MQRAEPELTLQQYARAGWHSFPDTERQTLACHNVSTLQDPRGKKRDTAGKGKKKIQKSKKAKGTTPARQFSQKSSMLNCDYIGVVGKSHTLHFPAASQPPQSGHRTYFCSPTTNEIPESHA